MPITLDIKKGDILLGGRFQNKRVPVKSIGTNDLNQPTVNGRSLLRYRIEKKLPASMQSSKTRMEKESSDRMYDIYHSAFMDEVSKITGGSHA